MVIPFSGKSLDSSIIYSSSRPSFSCVVSNSKYEDSEKLNKMVEITNQHILYYDEDVVFCNKPENFQTVPGFQSNYSLATMIAEMFKIKNIEQMSPHRLDFQTSGIVVFARNVKALRGIQEQFRERTVMKRYTAIVNGHVNTYEGEINLPIGKDNLAGPPLQTIDPSDDGRVAFTSWKVEERGNFCTKISLFPRVIYIVFYNLL